MSIRRIFILGLISIAIIGIPYSLVGQKADQIITKPLLTFEKSYGINFNSDGWGFGFRYGKSKSYTNKRTWDFSFNFIRDPKQIRLYKEYPEGSKSFFYGKLIHFYNLQALYGRQKNLTEKPYWGGVEIRYFYFGGPTLGIGKPIYLYIYDYYTLVSKLEKHDPSTQSLDIIIGRGPYSKGLSELQFYPAITLKFGLNVEFGEFQEEVKSLETGLVLDIYPIPVQIMGLNDPKYFMPRLYVSYRFGKRYNYLD